MLMKYEFMNFYFFICKENPIPYYACFWFVSGTVPNDLGTDFS